MLYILPIEPLGERYTEQWYRWFPGECERQGVSYTIIDGEPLSHRVEVGTFLDINSTLHYKSVQIKKISALFYAKQIKDGDVFFLADAEMFGLEAAVRYLAQLNKVDVRVYGFVHAGSYTRGDFVEPCAPFAGHYERAWGDIFDLVFVGSAYHKSRLLQMREVTNDKVLVTGNPYDIDEVRSQVGQVQKLDRVIHTNRPDPEKNPDATLTVFEELKSRHPDWEFMVTTGRGVWGSGALRDRALLLQDQGVIRIRENLKKAEYLQLVAESKVLTGNTVEENFGYCILEALIFDTVPVQPFEFSHPELVDEDERCLFSTQDEQVAKIERAMADPFPVSAYADKYRNSLSLIISKLNRYASNHTAT